MPKFKLSNLALLLPALAAVLLFASVATAAPRNGARAIIGNTVHGTEDDGEFYDYYAPNGKATSKLVGSDEITHGRWSIKGGNLCISYPDDIPACYRVELQGSSLTLTDTSSGEAFQTELLRGNPQGL